jgi:hypothetical protein
MVCFFVQFQKEFCRIQPSVNDFFEIWKQLAPHVVTYAEQKKDNSDVSALLQEMNNGGHGQTSGPGYEPPQRMYIFLPGGIN